MTKHFFGRHIVGWSSPESIAAGKISLLAVAEVILSVAAYWWIAWTFDTYAHLLISVVVAPLVLLRSDEAVALGVTSFDRYLNDTIANLRSREGLYFFIPFALAAGSAGWSAADWLLAGQASWPLVWRAVLIGILTLNVGVAFASAFRLPDVKTLEPGLAFVFMFSWPGFFAGILIRAVATRLLASLRHFHRGIAAFPGNWRRTLFHIDLGSPPELLPDLGKAEPNMDFMQLLESYRAREPSLGKIIVATAMAMLFIPSLLYRYALKSTCWLYLPVIYLAHLPRRLRDGEGRLIWVRSLPAKFVEWIRFALAATTLGIAAFALADAAELRNLLSAAGAGETPITIFSLLLVLDFGDMRPWHYFTLPSAALTVFLFLWLDAIRKDEAAGATIDALGMKIGTAIFADRLRSLLVCIWLGLALYYFADYAYGRCLLPGWMTPALEWRFGPPCTATGA